MVDKLPKNAVWRQFPGDGAQAHFYNANGFASGLYTPLLKKLSQTYRLSALEMRPSWPDISLPPGRRDWHIYANDLISFIEHECDAPIIGIGHSMGATCTIIAAAKRPDLFRGLALIEPAMVSKNLACLCRMMPKSVMNRFDPAKGTLKKTGSWESREAFLDDCRGIRGYKRLDEESFQMMAEHGVRETVDGRFTLAFSKLWEAHNYTQAPNVMAKLEGIKVPCVAVRGKPSVFFTEALWQHWKKCCPDTVFKEDFTYGHLMPLESPEDCFNLIDTGLSEVLNLG